MRDRHTMLAIIVSSTHDALDTEGSLGAGALDCRFIKL
jgi:hypothetical protein